MKQFMNILKNAGYLGIGTLVLAGQGVVYTVAKGKDAYVKATADSRVFPKAEDYDTYQEFEDAVRNAGFSVEPPVHECSESEYTDDTPNYSKPDDKHVNEEELLDMLDDRGYKAEAKRHYSVSSQ